MGEIGKFFSWEIIDDITAIKNCDKSFFEHNCSGVPKEIRWFFDSKDIKNGNKILLTLIYQDKKYEAHIEIQNFESPRTRMRWNGDLKKEFDEVLKDYRVKSGKENGYPSIKFTKISEDIYEIEFIGLDLLNDESINPLETIEIENRVEGKRKKIYTTKYERNPKNRKEAIKIHGTRCMVCDFDFEEVYGEFGKDFIEVHHTKPLYSLEDEVEINPEEDLVCLCSNCHRMIHRRRDKILTVEELKEIMEERSVFA
ncbi:MAG: HNH endonuclease [Intestinibacter bartlettii]|uniref:HNH endonuclease n=1 Tax=Intestinibacter bartlettii TaxID=261299 RepID=UPI0039A31509